MITISVRSGDKLDAQSILHLFWMGEAVSVVADGVRFDLSPSQAAANIEPGDVFLADVRADRIALHLVGEKGTYVSPIGVPTQAYPDLDGGGHEVIVPLDNIGAQLADLERLIAKHRAMRNRRNAWVATPRRPALALVRKP